MSTLGEALKAEGYRVNDKPALGRDSSWDRVRWLFVHHTADTCDPSQAAARASYIRTASGRYPPLAQVMLGRDGVVYVCSEQRDGQKEPGRASHAGEGSYPGIPTDQANEVALGLEVQCSGAHPLAHHADTYALMVRLLATLCRRYGLDASKVVGHKEYSSTGKIDPRDNCDTIRADVRQALEQGDDVARYASLQRTTDLALRAGVPDLINWEDESSDDWGGHNKTNAGINLPGGVVSGGTIFYTDGPCLVEVIRGPAGGEGPWTLLGATEHPGGRGTLVVPPASATDALYVRMTAEEDDVTLLSASLRLTVTDRQKG